MKKTIKRKWHSALTLAFSLQPLAFLPGCACPHRKAVTTHAVEVFAGRRDGLVAREMWRDSEGGGGFFFFADPNVQAMTALHTNQAALGGGSQFAAGSFTILVDSNLVPAIAATGTAAGNIIGAAASQMNAPIPNFYDPENARQLVHFAAASYESDMSDESDSFDVIANAATDTQAVICQTAEDLVVAFRGTRSLRNFVTDLEARRVPLTDGPAGAEVHEGFQTAFQSVSRELGDFLKGNLSAKQRLWLTGHSLGGALAKLAAARFFREHAIAGVYTFGEPRVGNAAFRNFYNWLRAKTFRVVDGEDFIPRLPWLLGAFRHCGTEVFYGDGGRALTPLSAAAGTECQPYQMIPPWWRKGLSDVFGIWAEWQRDGRLALLSDHHIKRYTEMLKAKS